MDKNNIKTKIENILKNKFEIDSDVLNDDNYDCPLTGKIFGFSDINLVYLFLETEKLFGINIPMERVKNEGFYTVNAIVDTIADLI